MKKRFFLLSLIFVTCCVIVSCGFTQDPDFPLYYENEEKVPENYEYSAQVTVVKKGFWLFWIFPFKFASESAAKNLMRSESRKKYPYAKGIYDLKITEDYGVGLFNWVPSLTISGKIVSAKEEK